MSELTVANIYSRLALGELANLTLVDNSTPEDIIDKFKPAVLMQLNKAMRDLFTRFLLLEKEVILNTRPEITHYFIRYEFAQSNEDSTQPVKYIDDSACENFRGDIVKVLSVYDGFGRQLHMNRNDQPLSVFTPQFDCLQITANHQSELFHIIFQSLHPELVDANSIINIPPSLEDSLLLLVASKIYSAIGGKENISRGTNYMQMYEISLITNEVRDLASTSENMSNDKLRMAGFV